MSGCIQRIKRGRDVVYYVQSYGSCGPEFGVKEELSNKDGVRKVAFLCKCIIRWLVHSTDWH